MAILKCKMCGGSLDLIEGSSVVYCEYCGSKQTIPKGNDEKKINLYVRANRLRFACEFDKAAGIYESILADFPEEAEGYWGLVLCKYGIEYVDDPATAKKIPTCHRSSFESIMDDPDYEQALENADAVARSVYRNEAKQIEEIRKGIIEISSKEEPYDIFICYKETAEDGQRTIDSVLAQDVYDVLTDKGYRTFFARITLEDKIGQEYEPYIFAALNSAKVMLAFGTDYEYFNAVWVKNEWSRYLKLMEKDKGKHLIPCYKGIDVYDIPKEFVRLQAQDLGKVGAVQDLVRGIEKLIGVKKSRENAQPQQVVVQQTGPDCDSLLKRVFLFMEDGEWDSADEYCEKVLDMNPENGWAYLGKLMVSLQVKKQEDLSFCEESFENNVLYKKALRFADDHLKKLLNETITTIKNRIWERKYVYAINMMKHANTTYTYAEAATEFRSIGNYKDSVKFAKQCEDAAKECNCQQRYKKAVELLENTILEKEFSRGIDLLVTLGDYRDCAELKIKYENIWNSRKEQAYEIWEEYLENRELYTLKMMENATQIDNKRLQELENEKQEIEKKIEIINHKSEEIRSLEAKLAITQEYLTKEKNKLSSLGVWDFYGKKVLSNNIAHLKKLSAEYSKQIYQAREFINQSDSVEKLHDKLLTNDKEYMKVMDITRGAVASLAKCEMLVEKLNSRELLVFLLKEEQNVSLILSEKAFAQTVKSDRVLSEIIENSESFKQWKKKKLEKR